MANVFVEEASLQAIADAIREKNGTEDTYTPAEMAYAIEAISGGGGINPTGTLEITQNGTYDVTNYASAEVDVPAEGITPTGTVSITQNGTVDVTNYASASVNVPNSYSASDEGKVVSSGELVAQTSQTYTENGTYDTTTIDEVTVNVSSGGGSTLPKTGTVTPDARTLTLSFDVGTTDTIKNIMIVPTSESPMKSNGKTAFAYMAASETLVKSVIITTNNTGSALLTPHYLNNSTRYSQSGSTITVSSASNTGGYFEAVSYTWFAW